MRRKILVVSAVTLFTPGSCGEDFLYRALRGSINQEVLISAEGVKPLTVSAYAGLTRPTGYDNMLNQVFSGVYGGDTNKDSESNDQLILNSVETYTITTTNDYLLNKWGDAYYEAQRCNLALNMMKETVDMDETIGANRTMELGFLRILFIFGGVKVFGPTGVPYVDETIVAKENDPKVHNDADIYPNILAGVETAIEELFEKQTEVACPTKTAVKALRTKVLMQQGDMAVAKPILVGIVADKLSLKGERLALQDDLDADFNAATENGKESTFEVQFSVRVNNSGNYGFLPDYPHDMGPGGYCEFYQPPYGLVSLFQVDKSGLPYLGGEYRNRKSMAGRVVDYDCISKNDKTTAVGPRLDFVVGRMEILCKDRGLSANGWVRNVNSGGVFLPKKHVYSRTEQDAGLVGSTYSSGWTPGFTMNLRHLCLRGYELLYAGHPADDGELNTAMQQINDIRERAAKPDNIICLEDGMPTASYLAKPYPSSRTTFSNRETCIKATHIEHKLELTMEGQQFSDLIRWGGDYINKELTTYISYEKQYLIKLYSISAPVTSRTMFPIPETGIQIAGNDEGGQVYLIQDDAWK